MRRLSPHCTAAKRLSRDLNSAIDPRARALTWWQAAPSAALASGTETRSVGAAASMVVIPLPGSAGFPICGNTVRAMGYRKEQHFVQQDTSGATDSVLSTQKLSHRQAPAPENALRSSETAQYQRLPEGPGNRSRTPVPHGTGPTWAGALGHHVRKLGHILKHSSSCGQSRLCGGTVTTRDGDFFDPCPAWLSQP